MIFLIEYDRQRGRIVTIEHFDDSERQEAEDSRLQLELRLHRRGVRREVVLLEAASDKALLRTHRRYFEDLKQLLESARAAEGASRRARA